MTRYLTYLGRALIVFALIIIAINAWIDVSARPYLYQSSAAAPMAEAVIVPGAGVFAGGQLSAIFKDRANTAIALYNDGRVQKILVSGDNSTVAHNEVDPVRNYLVAQGIPAQDIFLDHAGFDTYSTMYRAKAIFGVTSAIIATQNFHLPRAVFLARHLGITAYGVNAGPAEFGNYIREVFADEKAVFDLAIHRVPKYLGPQIPITGDGSLSP